VKHLASFPNYLNKSLNLPSLSYDIRDLDEIEFIYSMSILHFLILLYSCDRQIKKWKRD
jgi:hypothetical protein